MKDFTVLNNGSFSRTDRAMASTPAANSTISGSISGEYMYTIIGVYAVIIIIVFLTVSVILFKRLRGALCPHRHADPFGYLPVPQDEGVGEPHRRPSADWNVDELNHVVDIHGDNERSSDDDSEYDNISLEPPRTYDDPLGSDSDDDPLPDYEEPPSYLQVDWSECDHSPDR